MIGQNVLEVIAGTPDCRAVQIVDRLDIDAEEVLASVKALIQVGDIVSSEGRGPNGLACTVYTLSDAFKASPAYAPLAAKAAAKAFAAPGMNRVERAIEWVRQHGTATSAELHAVMGLRDDEAPSKVLSSAVTTKRLVKEGKNWTLGPGPDGEVSAPASTCMPKRDINQIPCFLQQVELAQPPAAAAPPAPTSASQPAPEPELALDAALSEPAKRIFAELAGTVAPPVVPPPAPKPAKAATRVRSERPKAKQQPEAPIVAPAAAAPETPAPDTVIVALRSLPEQPAPVYRCALWSDGMLEVQRDGQTVAQMPQAAGESLASFLARLAGAKEAA